MLILRPKYPTITKYLLVELAIKRLNHPSQPVFLISNGRKNVADKAGESVNALIDEKLTAKLMVMANC